MSIGAVDFDKAALSQSFTLTEGGPGAALMKQIHLVQAESGKVSGRTALILTALTWVPLFVLCLFEGFLFGRVKMPFLYDITAHTRFLLAVPVLVLADITVGVRLRRVVRHFVAAHLIPDDELGKFEQLIRDSMRFRDSHVGEVIVVILTTLRPTMR